MDDIILDSAQVVEDTAPATYQAIGREEVREAEQILQKYKQGKAMLEQRIIENEQWYKLRHNELLLSRNPGDPRPTSAWLFNCIANKHADAMDNYPEPNVLPREEGVAKSGYWEKIAQRMHVSQDWAKALERRGVEKLINRIAL